MTFENFLELAKKHYLEGKHLPSKRVFGGPDTFYCCPITAGVLEYNPKYNSAGGYTVPTKELTGVDYNEIWAFVMGYDGVTYSSSTKELYYYNLGIEFSKWLEQEGLYDSSMDSKTNG